MHNRAGKLPMQGQFKILFSVLGLALCFSSCEVHHRLQSIPLELKQEASYVHQEEGQDFNCFWWREFNQPALNSAIESALQGNFTIRQAYSRLYQARAEAKKAYSQKMPEINVDEKFYLAAGLSRPLRCDAGGTGLLFNPTLSYDIDIFRKIDSGYLSTVMKAFAKEEELEAARQLIAQMAADAWLTLVEEMTLKKIIEQQIDASGKLLKLLERRYVYGESAAFDVCQQRLQLESTKSALIPVEESIRIAGYQLDILMGRLPEAPGILDIDIASIELPPFPDMGSPLDLIRRRPDLKALARQVKALDFDVEEAIADLYPELSFSAGYWYKTENVLCFLRNGLLDAAFSLATPLFDGGKRRAEVCIRYQLLQEGIEEFSEAFLKAVFEVESAVVQEKASLQRIEETDEQLKLAMMNLAMAKERYIRGLEDYLTVIAQESFVQQLERVAAEERKNLLSNRAFLYRALGWRECQR